MIVRLDQFFRIPADIVACPECGAPLTGRIRAVNARGEAASFLLKCSAVINVGKANPSGHAMAFETWRPAYVAAKPWIKDNIKLDLRRDDVVAMAAADPDEPKPAAEPEELIGPEQSELF